MVYQAASAVGRQHPLTNTMVRFGGCGGTDAHAVWWCAGKFASVWWVPCMCCMGSLPVCNNTELLHVAASWFITTSSHTWRWHHRWQDWWTLSANSCGCQLLQPWAHPSGASLLHGISSFSLYVLKCLMAAVCMVSSCELQVKQCCWVFIVCVWCRVMVSVALIRGRSTT